MTELAGTDRIAPGSLEAWRRHLGEEVDPDPLRTELALGSLPLNEMGKVLRDELVHIAGREEHGS